MNPNHIGTNFDDFLKEEGIMTDKHLNFKITLKLDVCTEMTQQGLESHIGQLLKDSTLCDIAVDGLHIQNTRLCDCDSLEHLKNKEE